ncbi:MAG: amino acid permease [Pseudomonadota bacterium]|nr:amino acid permease [Gammaproteobacteria bacterium]MBU1558304.1 amino acid permease [Gammaproteobacteria bacterium]MBU1926767.1 amino acid permease [Gammaproteobacteria bacterium]MBU2546255.1 amino acid permease [Gammaproteobacteria bacterium]
MEKQKHYLSMFALAMLNVAAVMSLRGLPMMADTGLKMIFYLLFASFFFLIPCALISAELATGWPEAGGVYRWVKEAFGSRWGFVAIWLQWIQNVVWYPIVLAFAAASLAYFFKVPKLANNHWYTAGVILAVYWAATFLTFRGLKVAGAVTMFSVLLGTIFPGVLIIGLGVAWVVSGHSLAFMHGSLQFFPDFSHFGNVAFLASIVLLFAGMEVGAVHVRELKNPAVDYPRAILLATIIILLVFILGALSVAAVLPTSAISLTAGVMEAFQKMLAVYSLNWLLPVIGLLIALGALGGVMAWISGPSKGLLATAKSGEIPPILAHTNKHGIQTHILWIQGVIVTCLASLYLIMDNVSNAFFLLSVMTITLYLVMYFLLFAAGIRLRYSKPNVPRAYKIPGGNFGMWLVGGIGMLAVLFAFCVAFIPPAELKIGTPALYVGLVIAGLVFFVGAPIVIHAFKKESWLSHPNVKSSD